MLCSLLMQLWDFWSANGSCSGDWRSACAWEGEVSLSCLLLYYQGRQHKTSCQWHFPASYVLGRGSLWHYLGILQTNVTDVGLLLLSRSPFELEIWVLVRNSRHRPTGGLCLWPRDAVLLWGVDVYGNIGKDQRSRLPGCSGWGDSDPPSAFTESDAAVILSYKCPIGGKSQCELVGTGL